MIIKAGGISDERRNSKDGTAQGRGKVYTRTVGEGFPILLLHGGPGANHICFEIFEKYIDLKKFSLIYYDQLGSSHSDKITDESLLTFTRFVDEVEQVRAALGLERFILLGHSWGGMLCIDYALKYEKEGHLAGLVISNMVDSGKHYLEYLDHVRKINLTPEEYDYMTEIEAAGKESDAHYQELVEKLNCACLCRLEVSRLYRFLMCWIKVYHHFQGDNEFVRDRRHALLGQKR
ncbi:MAG: proline iminopeptidase-family hydrolase [Enterocloster sp.]